MSFFAKVFAVVMLACGVAQAFVAPTSFSLSQGRVHTARSAGNLVMEVPSTTYWEGKAPPSKVLGPVLSKAPSGLLGVVSLIALGAGTYAVHQSNIFHTLTPDGINPAYVVASFLCPIAWGLHVASWINKQNGN